jgi:hypothetical protein
MDADALHPFRRILPYIRHLDWGNDFHCRTRRGISDKIEPIDAIRRRLDMNMRFQSRIRPAASGHLAQRIDAQLGGETFQNRELDLCDFKNFFHDCCPQDDGYRRRSRRLLSDLNCIAAKLPIALHHDSFVLRFIAYYAKKARRRAHLPPLSLHLRSGTYPGCSSCLATCIYSRIGYV